MNHSISKRIRQIVGVCRSIVSTVCDINSYVPTPEKLRNPRNPSSAFIQSERDIRGVYGNIDVDSAIYKYETTKESPTEFWGAIESAATEDNWTVIDDRGLPNDHRRFLRISPKIDQQVLHRVEEARVAFNPESKTVVVAWVATSRRNLPTAFPTDGPGGRFAESVIWPQFLNESECSNGS